jgi:hypothetical protein
VRLEDRRSHLGDVLHIATPELRRLIITERRRFIVIQLRGQHLAEYLRYYNFERAHTGMRDRGLTPAAVVYGAGKTRPK